MNGINDSPAKQPYANYEVTLRFQYPAHDERDGIKFEETARSKSDAIKAARREADNGGHLCGGKGRVSFKAVKVSECHGNIELSGIMIHGGDHCGINQD